MQRVKTFDWSFVIVPLILVIISLATIYTITYVTVGTRLTIAQLVYAIIGFGLLGTFSFIDYRHYRSMALILFISGLLLLVPMLPVLSHKIPLVICEFNSCRWLNLGIFRLQTSEVFKLITIIAFSTILAEKIGKLAWWHLPLLLGVLALPVVLIMEQPDLGTAIVVIFCGFLLLLMARFPWWIWAGLLILGLISAPIAWQQLKPYQKKRIEVFLHPDRDPNKTGYNVRQAQIAVGSGGVTGRGFGKGSQSQLNFLPVAHTDFIFSGYAEATGYVGSLFLLGIFVFLLWRALRVAELAKDTFGRFLALGITAMLAIQILVNIGMNIRLMPVTGIPLPFISYGGTSLFVNMIAMGILQSIVIRHKKIDFS